MLLLMVYSTVLDDAVVHNFTFAKKCFCNYELEDFFLPVVLNEHFGTKLCIEFFLFGKQSIHFYTVTKMQIFLHVIL